MPLTPKQKAFAEAYIQTGNASEAARQAGYSGKTARQMGTENLSKPSISAYIKERMDEIDRQRVASSDEVLRFYSSVMRGEVKDSFGLDASLSDRIKAADSLMKRYAVTEGKERSSLEKLDHLLKEFHDAVNAETT